MFELANFLVGIYKVSDCTDSITMLNYPPTLPTQSPVVANSQYVGGTIEGDNTIAAENQDDTPTKKSQSPPSEQIVRLISELGRDTKFAPPLESTVRDTILAQNLKQAATEVAAQPSDATGRVTTDVSLASPPSSPAILNV